MPVSPEIDDVRIDSIESLISPEVLIRDLPVEPTEAKLVHESRKAAEAILTGRDQRVLVVVGPCSIHDTKAALEYAGLLKEAAAKHRDHLLLVMRVYFEKPRTTVGWKGLINDPDLDGSYNISKGLRKARTLLLELSRMGIPAGTEFLDTISPQYIADLITWGAIGARTTESQIHRELASGLSMPVGFKNGTGGSTGIAVDAIGASRNPHCFLSVTKQGVSAIVRTGGNPFCHLILRGSTKGTNYDSETVEAISGQIKAAGLDPHLMVDCSHGNSLKDHRKQPDVANELARQIEAGSDTIKGIMLESHLVEGNQKIGDGTNLEYGKSITDACMNWETTTQVLDRLAGAVASRC
ncbi:MAG: 3-deoxy-7-phosphoheptulonate synthase [Verrucomicrobiota bacterium]